MNLADLVKRLEPAVRSAGEEIMKIYETGFSQNIKDDGSPVTEADQISEKIILGSLQQIVPNIPVVSEENINSHHSLIQSEEFFLVDPLDGTKEFIKRDGLGAFTVNIGLVKKNTPILGLVFAPALDRLFIGYKNLAYEYSNSLKKRIKVRAAICSSFVAVASSSHRDKETERWLNTNNINKTVSIGSSLKFCLISSGEADIYPRFGPTMEWDIAAGHAVLISAGGVVTTEKSDQLMTYAKPDYKNGPFIAWGDYKKISKKINT